ncbi:MAG: protein phosphatase 2C domain-containing protein [Terrimicrobiaceae bacterium]|nr:protein phosphatase 2C domain-containing protein [Terrimicrobiaceae bacterium]
MGSDRPGLSLAWSGHTDVGRVRKNNEDSFLGLTIDAHEVHYLGKIGSASHVDADFVFAVSDGMGGAMAGEFASRIAVEKITRMLPPLFKQNAAGLSEGFSDVLTELFGEIHRALLYLGSCYEECDGMGATLSLCWFRPGWMYFAHVGDSRIYYLPAAGGVRQISHDDTYVGWMFRQGQINEREAKTHPRRNVLQKALGAGHQFVDPQVGAVGCEPGDRFLLCTDGVTDAIYDASLAELLEGAGSPAENLVREAVVRSGRDNSTAVIIRVLPH